MTINMVANTAVTGIMSKKERNDVVTALVLVIALGTGTLSLGLTNKYGTGAYSLLFGQIVGISSD